MVLTVFKITEAHYIEIAYQTDIMLQNANNKALIKHNKLHYYKNRLNYYYKIYLIIVLSIAVLPSWAQFNYNKIVSGAHNNILNLSGFDIKKHTVDDSNRGILLWLESYQSFVEIATTSKRLNIDSSIYEINKSLSIIENYSKTNPFYYYCNADLHLFLSFLYFEQDEVIHSLYQFIKAKSLIHDQQHYFPDFEFSSKHRLVLFFVNNFVNQQIGFGSMSNAELQNQYINLLDSHLKLSDGVHYRELKILGILLASYQTDIDTDLIIKKLGISRGYAKEGPVETYISSYWYKKAGEYSTQLSILLNAKEGGFQNKLNALDLWYGNALLNQNNDSSIIYLNKFLHNQQSSKFIQYARFKTSMYWFLEGNKQKSDSLNTLIKKSNTLVSSEDKQAKYESRNTHNWINELIIARTLFDGGNYIKSLNVLLATKGNVSRYNQEQKLEYSYRMGRIYDKLGDMDNAENFYQMVISSGFDSEFYYPAYAAYYLGNIYHKKGEYKNANRYFNICTQLDSPIYKSSIHKKAKSLITTIGR